MFFTSDTHFGHANIIKYSNRPFANADEMDKELIKRWNKKVPPNGIVYHLGDFSFHKPEKTHNILDQLNGKIHLILGNHDKYLKKGNLLSRFASVQDYLEIKYNDVLIVMCHYPFAVWNKMHYGSHCLHGHSHGSYKGSTGKKQLDVGVDTNNYTPYSLKEIKKIMYEREIVSLDHHKERK